MVVDNGIKKDNAYFSAFTGLRAVAAYMVYISHFNPFTPKAFGKTFSSFFVEFNTGVTLFFVLSGFLITFRYYNDRKFDFKFYIINRIARIYPMYFILTTITFLVYAFTGQSVLKTLLLYIVNITFISGYFDSLRFSGIAQGWSLTVEATFYLIAPLIFTLIKKNSIYFLIVPILLLLSGLLLVYIFKDIHFFWFFCSYPLMLIFTIFGRSFEFVVGIGLAIFYKNNSNSFNIRYSTYVGIVIIGLSIFLLSYLRMKYGSGLNITLERTISSFLIPLFGVSLLYYGLLKEKTVVSKILSSKVFVLLGKSSYVFYLIHMGVIADFIRNFTTNYIVIFLVLNVIAIFMFKFIEEPINNLIRNFYRKPLLKQH